jgi:hypothetical protein
MSWDYQPNKQCPKCGGETYQDSVDVGVGIIYGPLGCTMCGWSESEEYDQTIEANREPDSKGGFKDQYGGYHPAGSITALAFKMSREKE